MTSNASYLIDQQAAEKAVAMSLPLIEEAMKHKEVGDSGFLHLVIMDPLRTPENYSFEEAILYECSLGGDRSKWDADYAGFARGKARISWRTGLDSHLVSELRPHLLVGGDTVYWGSVVVDGIVVASSGVHGYYDEAFAGTIAMCLRAIAKARIAAERGKGAFLPG